MARSARLGKLVHDNAVFEVEAVTLPAAGAPAFHDDEVYLLIDPRGVLLPLHPWLVFAAPPGESEPGVWFLDGLRKDRAVYKSPQSPGQPMAGDEADFDGIRDRVRP